MNKLKIAGISLVAVIVVAVISIVTIETSMKNKIVIKNETDKKIEKLGMCFVYEDESDYFDIYEGSIETGKKVTDRYETVDFTEIAGDLEFYVTFEGEDEIFVYDGYFYTRYDGTIELTFYQKDGDYCVKTYGAVGLFGNTDLSELDSDIHFDFENSDWYYEGFEDYDFDDIDLGDLDIEDLDDLEWEFE